LASQTIIGGLTYFRYIYGQLLSGQTIVATWGCKPDNQVKIYRAVFLRSASVVIIAVASIWFTQRAFAVTLLHGILGG
jgi:hypothetical protein